MSSVRLAEPEQYLGFRTRETVRAAHLQALLERLRSRLLALTVAREGETEQADGKRERVGVAVIVVAIFLRKSEIARW